MSDTLGPALASLLISAEDALVQCDRPVGLSHLAPGNTVSWDNCCEDGGQLWVRVVSALPQPQGSQTCDITDLQVRAGLGVVRCMHGLSDDGFPTADQMTQDTLDMTRDADILRQAIKRWEHPTTVIGKTIRVEQGLPQGPQGLCGGWEWTLTFRLLLCDGC